MEQFLELLGWGDFRWSYLKSQAKAQVVSNRGKRLTISISQQAKDALDQIKHSGQSYWGMIQELIKLWKREHGVWESPSKSNHGVFG